MKKYFYWCGIIAPLLYVLAVIIGGALIPHYSHMNQAISEIDPLIEDKYGVIINILFGLYNILTLVYGIMLFILYKNKGSSHKIQSLSIVAISIGGLLMYFFPMDVTGAPVTANGTIHIVLAGLMSPLTILVCFLGYWTFPNDKEMRLYSLIAAAMTSIFGMASAAFSTNALPFMGLLERIAIGAYIGWIFISALYYKATYKQL
jgi:hypothetical membrane protein